MGQINRKHHGCSMVFPMNTPWVSFTKNEKPNHMMTAAEILIWLGFS
jgi:hypothetical protein